MPYLTTGWLDNLSVEAHKNNAKFSISIANEDISTAAIQIQGFYKSGASRVKYVEEFFTLGAGTMILKNYFVLFKALKFKIFISSPLVEVTGYCKDSSGTLVLKQFEVMEVSAP
ncbi:hypothetical protein Desor_0337 [Desulfosporosinus orientis DSM 765]|uniref:Uncharacterized protein n=1 Tax=Desulfosporosinus orientis (strain ATCC 19365 / DSM 765 / NCIMB 8382 / VKM B-1628 / Singapore I) TaxID=768706 RepID=G7W534_DESOD|nr:hypothetical protein [Desulfosporosinus orientis]AET66050.1 hypothetical protein Desor_0337 [Desulfosporosinus orientis DSM 765]